MSIEPEATSETVPEAADAQPDGAAADAELTVEFAAPVVVEAEAETVDEDPAVEVVESAREAPEPAVEAVVEAVEAAEPEAPATAELEAAAEVAADVEPAVDVESNDPVPETAADALAAEAKTEQAEAETVAEDPAVEVVESALEAAAEVEPAAAEPAAAESVVAEAVEAAPEPEAPRPEIGAVAHGAAPAVGRPAPSASRPSVQVGRVVEVTVSAIGDREVEVKLADGRLGVLAKGDIEGTDGRVPAVGDKMIVALLAREDPRQRVALSRSWAAKQQAWERLETAHREHTPVSGIVRRPVKGGFVVDIGVEAFLPASLVDLEGSPTADLVGSTVEVLVIELDRAGGKVVVNRRDLIRRQRRQVEKQAMSKVVEGAIVEGKVHSIAEYGALIDLGGVKGLLHRSEISWGRSEDPAAVYNVGDPVTVKVVEVHRSKKRISLSVRQMQADPLDQFELGTLVDAVITRVIDYGAFAALAGGEVEGLIHISEMSDVPGYRPEHLVSPGEQVLAKIIKVDPKRRRIGLSLRQALLVELPPE